jgi:uncharacterized protein DUF4153
MQSNPASNASTTAVWIGAALVSAAGAIILFDASPGVNWGIWVTAAAAAVMFARGRSGKPIEIPSFILLAWATVLAFGLANTDSEFIRVLIIVSDAMLLGLAIIVTGASSWSSLSASSLPTVPFLAPLRVWNASAREIGAIPTRISSPRARSIVRGLLLTVPIVIVLIALLRNADPIIAWGTDRITALLPQWSVPTRLLFFLFLLSLTLGANSISARQAEAQLPALPKVTGRTIGMTEQKMVLIAVAVTLWIFVLLQISYLFHSPPSAIGSGVTFANYARQGFSELSFAVTIVGGIILGLEATRPGDADPAAPRSLLSLETALIIALELILLSAFRRVILYEQAYGFTTARLFAQAYMVVMAVALVVLWLEVRKGFVSIAFARRVAVIGLAAFTVWVYWNYEAWIVNQNIDRSRASGKFDSEYATRLSRDAVPTLIARRRELPIAEQGKIDLWLGCAPLPARSRWFEWNRSVAATNRAMSELVRVPCLRSSRSWRSDVD